MWVSLHLKVEDNTIVTIKEEGLSPRLAERQREENKRRSLTATSEGRLSKRDEYVCRRKLKSNTIIIALFCSTCRRKVQNRSVLNAEWRQDFYNGDHCSWRSTDVCNTPSNGSDSEKYRNPGRGRRQRRLQITCTQGNVSVLLKKLILKLEKTTTRCYADGEFCKKKNFWHTHK